MALRVSGHKTGAESGRLFDILYILTVELFRPLGPLHLTIGLERIRDIRLRGVKDFLNGDFRPAPDAQLDQYYEPVDEASFTPIPVPWRMRHPRGRQNHLSPTCEPPPTTHREIHL